jgi:RNA polymerase sigma factor (sigma-70 family)
MDGQPALAESPVELAARLLRGDEDALRDILRVIGPSVRSLLVQKYRGSQTPEDIEDVLAIALYRLWRGRHLYRPDMASLQVWFYRIADNVVKDVLRSGWHKARQLETFHPDPPEPAANLAAGASGTAELDAGSSQQVQDLREIIAALPEVQQRIVWADAQARDQVVSSAALARELGLPASTVRVYRKRALDTIRLEMQRRGHQVP